MSAPLDIQSALTAAKQQPVQVPHAGASASATKKAAKDFESVFISEFLGSMFEGIQTDGMFGGGQGEQIFRSMMIEQYGKQIAGQGGFGIADAVTRSLSIHQQSQQREQQAAIDAANGKNDTAATAKTDKTKADKGIATAKTPQIFAAHQTIAAFDLSKKTPAFFAAHPATLFAASAAASAAQKPAGKP
jgi:flagellar protein FlgJ